MPFPLQFMILCFSEEAVSASFSHTVCLLFTCLQRVLLVLSYFNTNVSVGGKVRFYTELSCKKCVNEIHFQSKRHTLFLTRALTKVIEMFWDLMETIQMTVHFHGWTHCITPYWNEWSVARQKRSIDRKKNPSRNKTKRKPEFSLTPLCFWNSTFRV